MTEIEKLKQGLKVELLEELKAETQREADQD